MTRCLDCGSERTADQCSACGLTSAAAEVMFRRRFLKRTVFFLAGSLAFPYVSQIYAPLDLDLMLVFFGVIFFVALAIAVVLDRRARNRQDLEVLKRIYAGFIPLPWILAATLLLNGRLDSQKNLTYHPTTVDSLYNMRGVVRGTRRLFVHSWREGQKIERLAVDEDDYDRFRPGDAVVVGVEPGALGIPWYFAVYRQ
jgi:hypothetical protein